MAKFKKMRRKMMWPIQALGMFTVFYLVKCLPFFLVRLLGKTLGTILFAVPSQKKLVLANLAVAFPEKTQNERNEIGRQSLIGMVNIFCEMMWFHGDMKKIEKYLHVSDEVRQKIEACVANDRPNLMLTMHWGNWELSSFGYSFVDDVTPGTTIARRIKNPYIEKFMMSRRSQTKLQLVHAEGGIRHLVKAFKKGENVGLMIDQNTKTHQGGEFGNFFGLPATVSKTAATLARKYNANVFVYTCRRTAKGFELYVKELPKQPIEYKTNQALTQGMLDIMQETIAEYPEQWIWLYNRWNYIPKNMPELKSKYPYYAVMDKIDYIPE